jgi:ABC-type nitrate/sulfonate/bicarbonate transport system substrate-binding protein
LKRTARRWKNVDFPPERLVDYTLLWNAQKERQKGFTVLTGPPEVGVPGSGAFTSEKFLRENPLALKKTIRALLRAHNFILDNKAETIQAMIRWLPQSLDVATHSTTSR